MNGSNEKRIQPQLSIETSVGNSTTTLQPGTARALSSVSHPEAHASASRLFSLVDLDEQQLESIYNSVPGGAENVADVYPLSPLQEGMLFQHLLETQADTYILSALL